MDRKRATTAIQSRVARYRRRLNNSLQWEDVDKVAALSTADASSPIALLSLPLLREGVFACLVPSLDKPESFVNELNLPQYQAMLTPVRLVCHHWDRLAQMLLNDATKSVFSVDFPAFRPSQLIARLRRAESRGRDLRQLQLVTRNWEWYIKSPASDVHVDWSSFFAQVSNIVRLDISSVVDPIVKSMLTASSQACPHVKHLLLNPFLSGLSRPRDGRDGAEMTTVLLEALQAWYTANGGLFSLTIPHWVQRDEAYAPFLISVADFCPRMTYLRGWTPSDDASGRRSGSGYRPMVCADDWSMFCRRCPEIKTHAGTPGLFFSL